MPAIGTRQLVSHAILLAVHMSTDVATLLLRSPLQRGGPLPLHEQLRSLLEIGIISGDLEDGVPLPSVRRLARELGIAPSTVVRVYRDLLDEQLIKSVPQRGYFVTTGLTTDAEAPSTLAVRRYIDDAIEAAQSHGLALATFLQLVMEQVRSRQPAPRRVAVVGNRDAALEDRVLAVARALAGLPVKVIGLSYQELEEPDGSIPPADLADITWFLVPVGESRLASTLLGSHARRLVPMNRVLRAGVRDFIQQQPDSTHFGVIAGSDALMSRVHGMIQRIHPLLVPPIVTSIEHPGEVARALAETDVLIIGAYAFREIQHRLPPGKPWVELAYLPDEGTLRRLRSLVEADVANG